MLRYSQVGLLFLLVMVASVGLGALPTHAQLNVDVRTSPPLTDQFPTITLFLSVVDNSGRRIPGLPPTSFDVLEDSSKIPFQNLSVTEAELGTRQIFVINTNADMKVRDTLGQTRFDLALQALLEWWQLPAAGTYGIDELYLITHEGEWVTHSSYPAELASTLDNFIPIYADENSGYDLLLQALDFTSDPAPRLGMRTHLIFFSALPRTPRDLPLANIISLALETGTTIHPILIGDQEHLEQPEADPLRELAEATGGELILLDPAQGLPNLATNIFSQRTQYELSYTSQAITPGVHEIQVQISADGVEATSDTQNFEIDVRPPGVAFVQPPNHIIRETDDPSLTLDALPPRSQDLRLLITFPDEHPREIISSQLIVDGEVVSSSTEPPFDYFEWNLTSFLESETHLIQAMVEDSLGLRGTTIELPVNIEVLIPPRGLSAIRPALGSLLAALAVLVAGAILAAGLINLGRQQTSSARSTRQAKQTSKRPLKRAGFRKHPDTRAAEASLIPIDTGGHEGKPILLAGTEYVLGRDPALTPTPFDDPSVAVIHARLTRQAGGSYLLRDQNSTAGTWVNYDPIPKEGKTLNHGDLIHIGRVALRFQLTSPPPAPEIRVRPVTETVTTDPSHQELEN
jgi:pSer/pThr/pTyr-binding forkhead associated (FHA) protein